MELLDKEQYKTSKCQNSGSSQREQFGHHQISIYNRFKSLPKFTNAKISVRFMKFIGFYEATNTKPKYKSMAMFLIICKLTASDLRILLRHVSFCWLFIMA